MNAVYLENFINCVVGKLPGELDISMSVYTEFVEYVLGVGFSRSEIRNLRTTACAFEE